MDIKTHIHKPTHAHTHTHTEYGSSTSYFVQKPSNFGTDLAERIHLHPVPWVQQTSALTAAH